jgi:phosphotransferase system IIB component
MPTTIKLKNSVTTTNTPSSLEQGEVAINITDKKVWVGNAATTPIQLLGDGGSVTFTSLTVTGVSTFSAGTVSAPSITTSGDTNTGIFFPAADTIAFTEGGVESMRIDSSGNVGIGTGSPQSQSGFGALTVNGSTGGALFLTTGNTRTAQFYNTSSVAALGSVTSIPLIFLTGDTERMRIDSSGNVSIANSTARVRLDVRSDAVIAAPTPLANAVASGVFAIGDTVGSVMGLQLNGSSYDTYIQARNMGASSTAYNLLLQPLGGNVGIGNTNPAFPLDVTANTNSQAIRIRGRASDNIGALVFDNNAGNAGSQANYIQGTPNAQLIFGTNNTERMRIDSSGNVGIGTSSPLGKLSVGDGSLSDASVLLQINAPSSSATYIGMNKGGSYGALIGYSNGGSFGDAFVIRNVTATDPIIFATNNTAERMRITSGGELLVGQTVVGDANSNSFSFGTSGWANINHVNGTGSGTGYVFFGYNGAAIGSITQNGTTAVAYNTTSDYRLKENIAPLTNALAKVQSLKPVTYTWKNAPNEIGEGFIAHELAEVCPLAVTGSKDAVDAEGKPIYQSIDTSFLVATLTSAIQELHEIVKAQAAEIALLKSK